MRIRVIWDLLTSQRIRRILGFSKSLYCRMVLKAEAFKTFSEPGSDDFEGRGLQNSIPKPVRCAHPLRG